MDIHTPDLVFLSEPMTFQCDLLNQMEYFKGEYCASLNSEDLHNPELPLISSRAKGGTLVMWKSSLDPFISTYITDTSSFLPIILELPSCRVSIHIGIYLPTAGQDSQYIAELAKLRSTLDELLLKYRNPVIFLRGDANSSEKNVLRRTLLSSFIKDYNLTRASINHMTYHHFLGDGKSDSDLDVLLFSSLPDVLENLDHIHCKLNEPNVDSCHDILVSSASIPTQQKPVDNSENVVAPRIKNSRHKIVWSRDGILNYQQIITQLLPDIRARWQGGSSSALSVLLQTTNFLLTTVASESNKTISLSAPTSPSRSVRVPKEIRKSGNAVAKAHSYLKHLINNDEGYVQLGQSLALAKHRLKTLRQIHKKLVRKFRLRHCVARDRKLFKINSFDPGSSYKDIKRIRNNYNPTKKINRLNVGGKVYEDENIADGFYDSISTMKRMDSLTLSSSPSYAAIVQEYQNILNIVGKNSEIPPISREMTIDILKAIKPSVNDFFSLTAAHYQHLGEAGVDHLHFLINATISDLNNLALDELNMVWACVLHKGHGKDRTCDRSYRTISTCPLVSKAIDLYLSNLYSKMWRKATADTQFLRPGSSHELAAITLTEVINYSIKFKSRPTYVLYLDARSAFDLVLREFLVSDLYDIGMRDQSLMVVDARLRNRKTVCEWNKTLMGPITDECGVEQGGINSSEFYKVYNNEQLNLAQSSRFGIQIGPVTISSIGQADDVALVADNPHALQGLLDLSLYFCRKKHVTLNPGKTKLQAFSSTKSSRLISASQVNIDGEQIELVEEADHVGIVRSVHGNLVHIQTRFSAHRKQVGALLAAGLAKSHRANPTATLRAHQTYCLPVLLSGTAALVLKVSEVQLIEQYVKDTLCNLQKLLPKTPSCVIYFLGGQLPVTAHLHIRQLTLFGMVCRLKDSVLHQISEYQLSTSKLANGSWIMRIRELCIQYGLPSPLAMLQSPIPKSKFKSLVKSLVLDYWEVKLRSDALSLPSLEFFHPYYMSLVKPHPLWTTCNANPFEVNKAIVQARMLSGRYPTDKLVRHWSMNKSGVCLLPGCSGTALGNLEHLLLHCPALQSTRLRMMQLSLSVTSMYPPVADILILLHNSCTYDKRLAMQLILDCSAMPAVISLTQSHGPDVLHYLFYVSRNWCYSVHRKRMDLLGLYQYR